MDKLRKARVSAPKDKSCSNVMYKWKLALAIPVGTLNKYTSIYYMILKLNN